MKINISDVKIPIRRLRVLADDQVLKLAESIKEIGLINPITIDPDKNLICGFHRIEAMKLLGQTEIEYTVLNTNALLRELAEIDENLMRHNLNMVEKGRHLVRRKQIYEELHPETKAGVAGALVSNIVQNTTETTNVISPIVDSFVTDAAKKIGVSESTIQQNIKIIKDTDEDLLKVYEENPNVVNKTLGLKISNLSTETQKELAEKINKKLPSIIGPKISTDILKKSVEELGIDLEKRNVIYSFTCVCGKKYFVNVRTREVTNSNDETIDLVEE